MEPTVGIVCIARNEHSYIKEFINYHRTIGIHKFYIYDNGVPGDEPLSATLKNESDCIVLSCPGHVMQFRAYEHFITYMVPRTSEDWFAFIDIDEFICPVQHNTIQDFLKDYGSLKGIALNWRLFCTNGHVDPPEGGVLRNYTRSAFNHHVKTLAHRSVLRTPIYDVHNLGKVCRDLDGVLLNSAFSYKDTTDVIRLNHYYSKSWSEFKKKIERGRADNPSKRSFSDHLHENDPHVLAFYSQDDFAILDKRGIEHPLTSRSLANEEHELVSRSILKQAEFEKYKELANKYMHNL